jgi:hypothetical protein
VSTFVYSCRVSDEQRFIYDEDSLNALAASGLDWLTFNAALRGPALLRRPLGSDGLQVVARTPQGFWLTAGFVEVSDDEFLLVAVRYLSPAEASGVEVIFRGGKL